MSIVEELARNVKAIHESDSARAGELIETYLADRLKEMEPLRQIEILEDLRARFAAPPASPSEPLSAEVSEIKGLLANVLGSHFEETDPSTSAMVSQLSASLNRIFDSVNEIVGVIQGTLLGEQDQVQTIRRLIHSDLKESRSTGAIEKYLSQIKQAFLLSNRAFHMAARTEIKQILDELDPDKPGTEEEHGFKFGFLKKSDHLDELRTRFDRVKRWFESERFSEDLSREFERMCQRLYAEKGEASESEERS